MSRSEVDLLFVQPGSRKQIYQSLGAELAAVEPPVWAGLLATYVRKKGFSVGILDANAEELGPEEVAERVSETNPRLVAVPVYGQNPSASTQVMPSAGSIAAALKRSAPRLPVILVGGHVAALPERTLEEEACDFVATGEGFVTLVDLLEALRSGETRFDRVRGVGFREAGGRPQLTTPAPLVRSLDQDAPEAAWDLLPMKRYRAHNWHCFGGVDRRPYAALYTTLGCPYHCSFCCIQAPFKSGERALDMSEAVNSYRFWSPPVVLRQIEKLVEQYGVRNFKIADEMFVLNRRHVEAIADGIIERGYDINAWAYARVDTVKEGLEEKLRRAGFRWLAFGIEAASERVRVGVDKGFSQASVFDTLERVRRADINIGANYILGLPDDDGRSMEATLELALEVNAEYANFYSTMAYPGSALYQEARREGWPLPEKWSGYSQHSSDALPLPTRSLSAAEVLRFRDHAFRTYFTHPPYLARVRERFGPETVAHIQEMMGYRLERANA